MYSDEKAKKEAEKAEKLRAAGVQPQKKKAVGSKFFNDLAGLMGDEFMKRGATLHGCDVRTRDAFANMDIAGYNYGIYRYKHDLKKYPNRLILGSETFCNDAYRFREQAKKNPRLVGDFVWAGMDYLGEVGVGSWEYKAYATQFSGLGWTTAGSGRIDLNGRPLGEALYTRVALEQEIGPYIAVRPVMFSGEKHSPSAWKMTDAMPSWSWAGCEGKKAHIEVYARAAKVALLLNGKKVAEKQLKNDCLAKFTIPYQSGTLEAVSYDAIDRVLGRCKLQTAGADTVLRAVPEEKKTKPGSLVLHPHPLHRPRGRIEADGTRHGEHHGQRRQAAGGGQRVPLPSGQLPDAGNRHLLRRSAGGGGSRRKRRGGGCHQRRRAQRHGENPDCVREIPYYLQCKQPRFLCWRTAAAFWCNCKF